MIQGQRSDKALTLLQGKGSSTLKVLPDSHVHVMPYSGVWQISLANILDCGYKVELHGVCGYFSGPNFQMFRWKSSGLTCQVGWWVLWDLWLMTLSWHYHQRVEWSLKDLL